MGSVGTQPIAVNTPPCPPFPVVGSQLTPDENTQELSPGLQSLGPRAFGSEPPTGILTVQISLPEASLTLTECFPSVKFLPMKSEKVPAVLELLCKTVVE